jgi:hypothetical protein
MISRRHVYHIGGYDPISPELMLERFRYSMANFQTNWNVKGTVSDLNPSTNVTASWNAEASGPNWKTKTTIEMLRWDDLILKDFERGPVSRLLGGGHTLIDFIGTGTFASYLRSSWRYTIFFVYPYMMVLLFAVAGLAGGYYAPRLLGLSGFAAVVLGLTVALGLFLALMRWSPWNGRIQHAFDDWIFSREFVYGTRSLMNRRIEQFAETIVARARAADTDEIVVVGHCLGAGLVMQTVAHAMKIDPQLCQHGPSICVLTVGATIPKFSLHPKGEKTREAALAVAGNPQIRWTEYHARNDLISFYKFDPVTLQHISPGRTDGRPNIRKVQMSEMMSKAAFKKHRSRFYRMHYQFLMANDLRAAYDYVMILCGPLPFDEVTAAEGGLKRFTETGAVIASIAAVNSAIRPEAALSNVSAA